MKAFLGKYRSSSLQNLGLTSSNELLLNWVSYGLCLHANVFAPVFDFDSEYALIFMNEHSFSDRTIDESLWNVKQQRHALANRTLQTNVGGKSGYGQVFPVTSREIDISATYI